MYCFIKRHCRTQCFIDILYTLGSNNNKKQHLTQSKITHWEYIEISNKITKLTTTSQKVAT